MVGMIPSTWTNTSPVMLKMLNGPSPDSMPKSMRRYTLTVPPRGPRSSTQPSAVANTGVLMGTNMSTYMELRSGMSVRSVRKAKPNAMGSANSTPSPEYSSVSRMMGRKSAPVKASM